MIEIKSFPPPIYRLDKVNSYMISKLHNYLTKSKEISKSVFDKDIFTEIFIKDEIEQSNKELLEVGTKDRQSRIEPLTMGFDRSIYGYSKDPELIELEKQFYKFYIISLKKHLKTVKRISPTAKQNGSVNPDEVLKNPHETIFKDAFAFTLFDKMKGFYSKESTDLANYSFLFYAMQKDGFVICGNADFVKTLSIYNINIDKIDSKQSGANRKTNLYNATKESLQKKHGISTI